MEVSYEISGRHLETTFKLFSKLVDTVEPLQKDRAPFIEILITNSLATSVGKLVAKIQPFSFAKYLKALKPKRFSVNKKGREN